MTRNKHQQRAGISVLGVEEEPFKNFAEEVVAVLKSRSPSLISHSVLRVDVFRCPWSGRFILNEIEGKLLVIT